MWLHDNASYVTASNSATIASVTCQSVCSNEKSGCNLQHLFEIHSWKTFRGHDPRTCSISAGSWMHTESVSTFATALGLQAWTPATVSCGLPGAAPSGNRWWASKNSSRGALSCNLAMPAFGRDCAHIHCGQRLQGPRAEGPSVLLWALDQVSLSLGSWWGMSLDTSSPFGFVWIFQQLHTCVCP